MAQPVSQSRTMWVKKGTIVNGKKVKKGYVAQKGKPERRVTAKIKLEEATRRGKVGDVAKYKRGRYKRTVGKGRVDRNKTTAGGGVTKAEAAAARKKANAGSRSFTSKPSVSQSSKGRTGFSSSAANRGGYSAAGYRRRMGTQIAGSGSDAVNAATSSGSARVSSARDSFISEPGRPQPTTSRNPYKLNSPSRTRTPSNRPVTGEKMRLQKDKSGRSRWVKVM